jgi:hypothetical protein
MDKLPVAAVPSHLWCPDSNGHASPVTIVRYMTHARLLLVLIAATSTLTSMDRCYYNQH